MTFCIDIDNTISDMNRVWLRYINREYHTKYKYSDITHWEFFDELGDEGIDAFEFLDWVGFWKSTIIYPNAVKIIEALVKANQEVYLVTATDILSPALTAKVLHTLKSFDPCLINEDSIVIAQDKSIINGDVLIDDKLETCQEWLRRGKAVYMPEQPWNTEFNPNSNCNQLSIFDDEDGDNMNRRWLDVLEYINKQFKLNLKFN